jgi:FkbM family methyltransferase
MKMKHITNDPLKSLYYFVQRYIFCNKFLIAINPKYGVKLRFKTEDAVGRCIYKTGTYERVLTNYLTRYIPFEERDIFVDVGANIGWYSLVMSKVMPPTCRIYAFEPDQLNSEILRQNRDLNRCSNLEIITKALGEESGRATLFLYPDKNRGRHSMIPLGGNDEQRTIEVVSLDDYFKEQGVDVTKIKLLKIDIEGFEYPALLGAKMALQNIPNVLMEYSPEYMEKGGFEPLKLIELMEELNFNAHRILETGLERLSPEILRQQRSQTDLLWIKN